MTRACGCSGHCDEPEPGFGRREFLQSVLMGATGLFLTGMRWAETAEGTAAVLPALRAPLDSYPLQKPRTYSGEHLEYVLMPIGGIGTGTIWLDGQGRLAIWQIFNNFTEVRVPDSFFAVRAAPVGGRAVVRVLQTVPEPGFRPLTSLTYEGGYPVAGLNFTDDELPVTVRLEGFNPMIPLDAANSSLPCALFRITVTNPGAKPVDVSVLGTLQNAVGSGGRTGITGTHFADYGGNRNRILQRPAGTVVAMEREVVPPPAGPMKVRNARGLEIAGPSLLWLPKLHGPLATAAAGAATTAEFEAAQALSVSGGGCIVGEARPDLWEAVAQARQQKNEWSHVEVFEDFEKDSYAGWTVEGTAFGKAPATGTAPGQQPVSGFLGKRLVNSYPESDAPHGKLTSRSFRIEHRYIGFLIGGGNHPGETCMNLVVGGRIVRTATGRNEERLLPQAWDVGEFRGQDAVLEIVDNASGGWGHINLDQIVFADAPPDQLLRLQGPFTAFAAALPVHFDDVDWVQSPQPITVNLTDQGRRVLGDAPREWRIDEHTRLVGFRPSDGVRVLAETESGDPVLLATQLGKSEWAIGLAPGMPWEWAERLLITARAQPLADGERLVSGSPDFGTMALAVDAPASGTARWTDPNALAAAFQRHGELTGASDSGPSADGETCNAALAVPFRLQPGESRTTTFAITWHFPNIDRFGHPGNLYSRRFPDAVAVADYLLDNSDSGGVRLKSLWGWTERYHSALYQSNLPAPLLDAFTSQSVVFRGPTCFWSEDGYFGGFEGSYGCCPLNCTHVWNYAQTHARLFPEIGRNMRESDLLVYLHPDGETSHRQHTPCGAFIDGHCATIEAAYREHLTSPDKSFLERIWPKVKLATDWMIAKFDAEGDGVLSGLQWNTYDCAISGAQTLIGAQYLSALGAAERMAETMGDRASAATYRRLREAGSRNQNARLWNGEYFIQIPGDPPANDYNTGCHSDQLLGQWWAHQLGLGYLYPQENVRTALRSILRNNYRTSFAGIQQKPRRYILDDESALLICTWPKGGRPEKFILYADEAWTSIEYEVAGLMLWEGMIDDAVRLVDGARKRYDGRPRDGVNSGPGGNPFNELECGKFYARPMCSGGLLLAAQGFRCDGPAGMIGFAPRWQPADHRSFFIAAEGWGLFVQTRQANQQTNRIELRYGRLRLRELRLTLPDGTAKVRAATVAIDGRTVACIPELTGTELRLRFNSEQEVTGIVQVDLRW